MPKFSEHDREAAKAHTSDPLTLDLLIAYEAIAKAAFELWRVLPAQDATRAIGERADDLYDALSVVNFMQEDE